MGTPIDHKEIRKGDRVREITRITSHRDYTADMDGNTLNRYGNGDKSWELLDRPRKPIHAKGTTLYLKMDHHDAKKGDRVEVNSHERFGNGNYTVVVSPQTGDDRSSKWINPRFLSETLVEPEPTIVAVPLPAIEKLRDAEKWADERKGDSIAARNVIRREGIHTFLDTREVKTALREDDRW